MPDDKLQALQLPATLMERLALAVGQPAVVYLMGVHSHVLTGMPSGGLVSYSASDSEVTATSAQWGPDWCPPWPGTPPCPGPAPRPGPPCPPPAPAPGPCPEPAPCPGMPPCPGPAPGAGMMMGTAVLSGTLAFAGSDFIDLHVPITGTAYREVFIPYNAIGMILPGGPTL